MKSLPARPYKDGFDEWVFIYKHNMKVCLILLLGLVTLGILTLLNLLWTGLALTVAARFAYLMGTSWQKTLALILPHGFLEIIVLTLVGEVGVEGLFLVYRKLRYDQWCYDINLLFTNVKRVASGSFLILTASIIETLLTGQIAEKLN